MKEMERKQRENELEGKRNRKRGKEQNDRFIMVTYLVTEI